MNILKNALMIFLLNSAFSAFAGTGEGPFQKSTDGCMNWEVNSTGEWLCLDDAGGSSTGDPYDDCIKKARADYEACLRNNVAGGSVAAEICRQKQTLAILNCDQNYST